MASIASIAPEYDMGVLEALDALGLDDARVFIDAPLDADREKWVREQLNEASRPKPALETSTPADPRGGRILDDLLTPPQRKALRIAAKIAEANAELLDRLD